MAERVALLERRDVLLVRTGLHPEVFDPVTAEVVLYQAGEAEIKRRVLRRGTR